MKKDKLEEFIIQNRDEFDDLSPRMETWDKIEKNISAPRSLTLKNFLWKAAAVLVIFTSSFIANELWHQYRDGNGAEQVAVQAIQEVQVPELLEAEVYYTSKVEERLKEFKQFGKSNPELAKELNLEMEELDIAFGELKEDLKDDMANEDIVEAMIQNYRIKLKMLEEIISELKSQEENIEKDNVIEYEI